MKKLLLKNESFQYIEKSFREWLDILGYAESTVYNLPNHIRELFYYLEQNNINNIASCSKDLNMTLNTFKLLQGTTEYS